MMLKKKSGSQTRKRLLFTKTVEIVRIGVNASYKYIPHDPLGRETDGICSEK